MESVAINSLSGVQELASLANSTDEPLAMYDGEDECMIVMRPAVFERILFDSSLLNCSPRESLHL